jgi:probable rRNA maturation factor
VKIILKNLQKKLPIYPKRIKRTILNALNKEGIKNGGELTFCFVSDKQIRALNAKFHKDKRSTDVLAFDLSLKKNSPLLADIIISTDTAISNARRFKTDPISELNLYCLHGVLHLLGYKDKTTKEKKLMRKKESTYVHP